MIRFLLVTVFRTISWISQQRSTPPEETFLIPALHLARNQLVTWASKKKTQIGKTSAKQTQLLLEAPDLCVLPSSTNYTLPCGDPCAPLLPLKFKINSKAYYVCMMKMTGSHLAFQYLTRGCAYYIRKSLFFCQLQNKKNLSLISSLLFFILYFLLAVLAVQHRQDEILFVVVGCVGWGVIFCFNFISYFIPPATPNIPTTMI